MDQVLQQLAKCKEAAPYLSYVEILQSTGNDYRFPVSDEEFIEELIAHEAFLKKFSEIRQENDFSIKTFKEGERIKVVLEKPYPTHFLEEHNDIKEVSGITGTVLIPMVEDSFEDDDDGHLVRVKLDFLPESAEEWHSDEIEEFSTNLIRLSS